MAPTAGIGQHAEQSTNGNAETACGLATEAFVDQEEICREFAGDQDSLDLSPIQRV